MPFGEGSTLGFNNPVDTQIIVIEATPGTGLFFYSPSAGFGNLVASFTAFGGTDKYGNPYDPGLVIGTNAETQLQLESLGGTGILNFLLNNAGIANGFLEGINFGTLGAIQLQGPQLLTAGFNDYVVDDWLSSSSSGPSSSALRQLAYVDANGGTHGYLTVTPAGTTIEAGSIAAVQPGTGTNPTNPAVGESWHSLGLENGWSASGNGVSGAWYKMLATGDVLLAWDVTTPSATPGVIAHLPSGYTPGGNGVNLVSGWYGTGPTSYNDTFGPHIFVDTSGNLNPEGIKVSTVSLHGTALLPLGI
jgi:hypothetical protein